ncbi:hypothetical protein IX38_20055 [Chryseobacterium luteum]|uniref:Uncharacterized protein n=1 Tax=Chryseobacterium luteum TaxID=421531 RepID=A0A085YZG1_9FLAO|nr:hypothetical protein IX38_20055 [Chryseobacterium luteum]
MKKLPRMHEFKLLMPFIKFTLDFVIKIFVHSWQKYICLMKEWTRIHKFKLLTLFIKFTLNFVIKIFVHSGKNIFV